MYAVLWASVIICLNAIKVLKEVEELVWTEETLWELRQQITLNSLYVASYENKMGVDASAACDFFEGYMDYLEDIVKAEERDPSLDNIFAEDNSNNLWCWFLCHDTNPLPTK